MNFLLMLAFRNIWRNKRRTLIAISSVTAGIAAIIFLKGFSEGAMEDMRMNTIQSVTGHVQIHHRQFEDGFTLGHTLKNPDILMEQIKPRVEALAPRLLNQGLIGTDRSSKGVVLVGINPELETQITRLSHFVKQGVFLSSDKKTGLMIGDNLAKRLQVKIGDKILVLVQDAYGMSAGNSYEISAIFHSGVHLMDEQCAYLVLSSLQELLDAGPKISTIAIKLKSRKDIPSFMSFFKTIDDGSVNAASAWNELMPEVDEWVDWSEMVFRIVMFIVSSMVVMGILNTVFMSIFERTREFGVMQALGIKPAQISTMIFLEIFFLEIIGVLSGTLLGFLIISYFAYTGISLAQFRQAFEYTLMGSVVYPIFNILSAVQGAGIILLFTLLTMVFPILKIIKLKPIKAIYFS